MRTRAALGAKMQQNLKLAPGVQLALQFLQMPAVELRGWINQEILANPLLELADDEESVPEAPGTDPVEGGAPAAATSEEDEARPPEWPDFVPTEADPALPRGIREPVEPEQELARPAVPTLAEALLGQLRLAVSDPALLEIGEYLIGCLDERGYLGCSVEDVADDLGRSPAQVERALAAVQALDPPGIGARDLRECLRLQLRMRGRQGSLAWDIIETQFDNLTRRRHTEMARRLKVTLPVLEEAVDEIRSLKPHPGRLVAPEEVRYIYPDLIVTRIGDRLEVFPSDRSIPRLRVAESYRRVLADPADPGSETEEFVRSRLRSARWLVQALDRRRDTMIRVTRAIVDEQIEFFEKGLPALRPLTLQTVARQVGMHESTVARVTKAKYVQTPKGIFPLKFFFSGRIPTERGGGTSAQAVRERIRALIREEDGDRPLSDEAVAGLLEREGIRIARRTVAKYRDQMKIERAQLRRRHRSTADSDRPRAARKRRIA